MQLLTNLKLTIAPNGRFAVSSQTKRAFSLHYYNTERKRKLSVLWASKVII